MNEKNILIKEKHPDLFTKGFTLLGLMVASLLCAFAPLLVNGLKNNKNDFYIVGGLLFIVFVVLFVRLIIKEFHPSNLLVLSSNGFIDNKNVGSDIEIAWTNVASVKLMGEQEMPYLGITLDNSDIVMAKMKKRVADEMRDNIDDNLPHILIPQNEVYTPLEELKETFIKFIREARVLDRETAQKPKNNPFTTDDVLRAFGQLPPENEEISKTAETANDEQVDKKTDTLIYDIASKNEEDEQDEEIALDIHTDEKQNTSSFDFPDSFYEILSSHNKTDNEVDEDTNDETAQESDVITESSDVTNDTNEDETVDSEEYNADLSEEINDFLSRAKFSKISEINKILNETDVPTSLSYTEKEQNSEEVVAREIDDSTIFEEHLGEQENVQVEIPENDDNDGFTNLTPEKEFCIEFPADEVIESNNSNDDITFENLFLETKIFDDDDSDTNSDS